MEQLSLFQQESLKKIHIKNQKSDSDKRVLSLFSGCGGMDLGFEGGFSCLKRSVNTEVHPDWIHHTEGPWAVLKRTGFTTVFANDILPFAKSAWVSYFGKWHDDANTIYTVESIVDLVKKEKNGYRIFPRDIDVITGGFPCQDFSVAGKRKGFLSEKSHNGGKIEDDEPTLENRGHLYMWMREVVTLVQPKLFIAENVKGLTNLEDAKQVIEKDFSNAAEGGYLVLPARVLHAADYGVPQSRERVIFYGFRKSALKESALDELSKAQISNEYDPYPVKTHAFTEHSKCLMPFVTCTEAFTDLTEPEDSRDEAQKKYSKAKFMGKHCQGQTEVKMDSIAPTIRSEHHGNIEFRRLSPENGGRHTDELAKGLQERRLSVRECARIQTFPDDYQFVLPKTDENTSVNASNAYKIIGNAVPCILGYHIAMRLRENWDKYFK